MLASYRVCSRGGVGATNSNAYMSLASGINDNVLGSPHDMR